MSLGLPFVQSLAASYCRHELPAWGRLIHWTNLTPKHPWPGTRPVSVRDKNHGLTVTLDPQNWSDRYYALLARPYDLPTLLALDKLAQPGDHAVDIGANIGVMTLHLASRVGPQGKVLAFEPNPAAFARLKGHVDSNRCTWAHCEQAGASNEPGELTLRVLDGHTGSGTLRGIDASAKGHVTDEHRVQIVVPDDLIEARAMNPTVIKIDVEGFETRVLKGLARTLHRCQPAIVSEVDDAMLRAAGSSAREYADLMQSHGYRGWSLALQGGLRKSLALRPLGDSLHSGKHDAVFVVPNSPSAQRLGV
jgi:FkbM family methyltransferase